MERVVRALRTSIVGLMLWLLSVSGLEAQQTSHAMIASPQAGQVFAWGRNAPEVRIESHTQLAPTHERAFVTVNILSPNGQVIDRVPLFDDGTHGDNTPEDGRYVNSYRPPRAGEYVLKARMQFTDTTTGTSLERWSEPISISVKQVPYCRIVSPSPGEKVANRAAVTAALLIGSDGSPYRPANSERLRIRAWAEPGADADIPERVGERFKCTFSLPRAGQYRLHIAVQSLQNGQWVESEADAVTVNATARNYLPLVVFGILAFIYPWLPRRLVTLYRHHLRVSRSGEDLAAVIIDPELLKTVTRTVGGPDCDVKLRDVSEELFTIIASPGEESVTVRVEGDTSAVQSLRLQDKITAASKDFRLTYCDREPLNRIPRPRLEPSTWVRWLVLVLAILSIVWFAVSQIAYTMLSQST